MHPYSGLTDMLVANLADVDCSFPFSGGIHTNSHFVKYTLLSSRDPQTIAYYYK